MDRKLKIRLWVPHHWFVAKEVGFWVVELNLSKIRAVVDVNYLFGHLNLLNDLREVRALSEELSKLNSRRLGSTHDLVLLDDSKFFLVGHLVKLVDVWSPLVQVCCCCVLLAHLFIWYKCFKIAERQQILAMDFDDVHLVEKLQEVRMADLDDSIVVAGDAEHGSYCFDECGYEICRNE